MADGFEVPEPVKTLTVDQPPYKGAEFTVRVGLSPATYFGVRQWIVRILAAKQDVAAATAANDGNAFVKAFGEFITAVDGAAGFFVDLGLVSWTLLRKGKPIPATVEGMALLDAGLQTRMIAMWAEAIGTVSLPLSDASPTGPTSRTGQSPTPSTSGPSSTATFPPTSNAATPPS